MEKEEVRQIVMAILSGYLAYIGIRLVADHIADRSAVYLAAGAFFALFGAAAVILYIRRIIAGRRARRKDGNDRQEDTDEK